MTASEFVFLAMGLILGLAAGAALVEILRARPPVPREVRVTMATDAVPKRSTTLADAAQAVNRAEPARGGPADRREGVGAMPGGEVDRRTAVRSGAAAMAAATTPIDAAGGDPRPGRVVQPAFALSDTARPSGEAVPAASGMIPVSGGTDPMMRALRASMATAAVAASAASRPRTATAVLEVMEVQGPSSRTVDDSTETSPGVTGATGNPGSGREALAAGPCAEVRRVAAERCELATRAGEHAAAAADRLRAAQRAYEEHEALAAAAQAAVDPRAIRAAKDEAQQRFRDGRGAAASDAEVEEAARTWLAQVNDINSAAREAAASLARERAAAQASGTSLERLALEADAARISSETAAAACLEAREAVAACDEDVAAGAAPGPPVRAPGDPFPTDDADPAAEPLPAALAGGSGTPRIFRLLRGDRAAMAELVAALAGDDPETRRHWQLAIARLVDAILADAIEAGAMEFPSDHGFWGPFTVSQDRDIVRALASLGYRFDGLGGWLDDRVPSQRDLSLALGYAGLDPMRMRHWPNEAETTALFTEVTVAADEHLAGAAGDLTLGELVSMLDRRADGLADLWNDWGRIRPLLLQES